MSSNDNIEHATTGTALLVLACAATCLAVGGLVGWWWALAALAAWLTVAGAVVSALEWAESQRGAR